MATKKDREKMQNNNGPRETLDIDKIVNAAMKLLNEEGLQQLTTRRLAESLGKRSAALYWHVRDKAELLQLLAENISSKIKLPDPSLPWSEQMYSFAMDYRAILLSIRDSAEVLLEAPPSTPKRLALIEAMFKIFVNAGFLPKDVVMGSMLINDYILSFVKNEMIMSNVALSQGISEQEAKDNSKKFFANLSPDQYPTIISLSEYLAFDNMDEHFKFGIETLLSSLEKRLTALY